MKSYDEFPGLSEDEIAKIVQQSADALGLEQAPDGETQIPFAQFPSLVGVYSALYAEQLLRKYHEWLVEQL